MQERKEIMVIKLCARCKKTIQYPNRYCDKCLKIVETERQESHIISNRKYNKTRDNKYLKFYKSSEWKLLKEKRLQDSKYLCERCAKKGIKKIATEVHHKKPIQTNEGWEKRLDYNNTESVCIDCHNFYHKRFQKRIQDFS